MALEVVGSTPIAHPKEKSLDFARKPRKFKAFSILRGFKILRNFQIKYAEKKVKKRSEKTNEKYVFSFLSKRANIWPLFFRKITINF